MPPVIVTGSHRSGTSATARVINLLGLPTVESDELMIPNEGNPDGYWESRTLTEFDDRLLAVQGCSWSAPPVNRGTNLEAPLGEYTAIASGLLRRLLPEGTWMWKDPRVCLLLPFWRSVVPEAVYVLVHRGSMAVAESLSRRDQSSLVYGLAIWQRYVSCCLTGLEGARVVVVSFEDLSSRPEAAVAKLADDLTHLGVATQLSEEAWKSLHQTGERSPVGDDEPAEARSMTHRLLELNGPHASFPQGEAPQESQWVEPLVAVHRRAEALRVAS